MSGPGLVYLITRFSYVKPSLLSRTEAWTAHGVLTKIQDNGRVGGKKKRKKSRRKREVCNLIKMTLYLQKVI